MQQRKDGRMAIYANGPSFQSYSVGTAPTALFYTRGYGGTAIGTSINVHNPTIVNAGTVTLYVTMGGTAVAGTANSAANILQSGVALLAGQQMTFLGTAVTGTALTIGGGNVYDMYGCTKSGTTFVESGYATQTIVS
jgi:hypothetical protein